MTSSGKEKNAQDEGPTNNRMQRQKTIFESTSHPKVDVPLRKEKWEEIMSDNHATLI